MSGKLDQSLDEILSTNKRSVIRGKGRGHRRASQPGRAAAAAAPVGGVKKNTKQAKGTVKTVPTGPSGATGDSRIQVSNLVSATAYLKFRILANIFPQPKDVNEAQIKVCYR
jgi:THO complex subunit 4